MDFRMEKSSWAMIAFMFASIFYAFLQGSGTNIPFIAYVQTFFYTLISVLAIIAIACIPVIIVCYFIKKIPDIDYSINLAFAVIILGIISELF